MPDRARHHEQEALSSAPEVVEVDLVRGGTSKGVFIRLDALPNDPVARDAFALALMGSPDPMQLDGLGGTHSSTSKVIAVGTPAEARRLGYTLAGANVAYLFAQVGVADSVVDWNGNCGNLTAGVAPYALRHGLVRANDPLSTVSMVNLNSGVHVTATVPTRSGTPIEDGDFALPGVPGTGARIDLTFHNPASKLTGTPFPTGHQSEVITVEGNPVETTIIDVTNPVAIIAARAMGLRGTELPSELNRDPRLLRNIEAVRAEAAVRCGLVSHPNEAASVSPAVPRVILVSPPQDHQIVSGQSVDASQCDYVVRTSSMGVIHHAFTGTGLMAAAVGATLNGTVFQKHGSTVGSSVVRLAHPKGVVELSVDIDTSNSQPTVRSVTVTRTARRLLSGVAYIKRKHHTPS